MELNSAAVHQVFAKRAYTQAIQVKMRKHGNGAAHAARDAKSIHDIFTGMERVTFDRSSDGDNNNSESTIDERLRRIENFLERQRLHTQYCSRVSQGAADDESTAADVNRQQQHAVNALESRIEKHFRPAPLALSCSRVCAGT